MFAHKLENLDEMYKSLENHKILKLTQQGIENLNKTLLSEKSEWEILQVPTKKCSGLVNSTNLQWFKKPMI